MCYASSCNPTCGDCRPRRLVPISCPGCGAPCSIGREEYLILTDLPHKRNIIEKKIIERGGVEPPTCAICGAELLDAFREEVGQKPCRRSRIICGFPCGRCVEPYREGAQCATMVPVGKYVEEG